MPAAPLTTMMLVVSGLALLPLQASPQLMTSLSIAAPTGTSVSPDAITYLLLLGVVGSGVSTMAYIWLVLKRGPLFAGMTTYVVPVIALLWGTLDHEAISGQQAMAIAGVLGMVALVQTKSKAGEGVLETGGCWGIGDVVAVVGRGGHAGNAADAGDRAFGSAGGAAGIAGCVSRCRTDNSVRRLAVFASGWLARNSSAWQRFRSSRLGVACSAQAPGGFVVGNSFDASLACGSYGEV